MTPLAILLGLTPGQAVSTGKFNGLSLTVGSLVGMKSIHGRVSKRRVVPVMILAFIVGLLAPLTIRSFDNEIYRLTLGGIIILMIPVMIFKKVGLKPGKPNSTERFTGSVLLAFALWLQGVFSGGLGTLVNVVLMGMLGMTATEANLTKRWSQLILNTTIIFGVLGSGLIVWPVAIVGIITTFIGGYIGGGLAVKKGDGFILRVMVLLMFVSGVALIAGA